MATHEEHLARVRRTPAEIAALVEGRSDADLGRRPAEKAWAAKEVICHLRDTEESFMARFYLALHNDTPKWLPPAEADRWAAERLWAARGSTGRSPIAAAGSGYDIRTIQQLLDHRDASTTMISTRVLDRGGRGVRSHLDRTP